MRVWVALIALGVVAGATGARAGEGVWLRVQQNGVFGNGTARTVDVAAIGSQLRLIDRKGGRAIYVDRLAREVCEVDTWRNEFVRKPYAAYRQFREQRAERRAELLTRISALLADAESDDERAEIERNLRELGLRKDGAEQIRTAVSTPHLYPLTLNGLHSATVCRPTQFLLNQAPQPVATLQVADHLTLPVQPLAIYVELGMLPHALESALDELEGTPIAGDLLLDDGSLSKRIRFQVLEVRSDVEVGDLSLPGGLRQVAKLGEATQPKRQSVCQQCGDPVGEAKVTLNGLPFCSREHRHDYVRANAKRARK